MTNDVNETPTENEEIRGIAEEGDEEFDEAEDLDEEDEETDEDEGTL
jgi:hypothetical protein